MALKLFNTLSRSLQEFVPLDATGKQLGLYCCGPTVYDFAHIGNWRTFIFGDLVRRYLEFKGYAVLHVMNITDVDDFALWKARASEDGGVFWPSPWGDGRPGWHIECSAMSMKLLGPSFELHLGGEDLMFPHHEDEIAQSEGAGLQPQGQRFVKYWLHGAHLLVEGKKMSKSLGNFFTLRDLLAKGYTGREIRYLLLQSRYRETFNFTMEGLQAGQASLMRLDECLGKLRELAG